MNEILGSPLWVGALILLGLAVLTMIWPEKFWWVWRGRGLFVPQTRADLDATRIWGLVMLVAVVVMLIYTALNL